MKDWNVEFDYSLRHGGAMTFQAETKDEAEQMAYDYVRETYDDAVDIEVVEVDEVKNG
jgi:hypothetical protein